MGRAILNHYRSGAAGEFMDLVCVLVHEKLKYAGLSNEWP